MPGPPFTFGAILVILALIVALFIPENPHTVVKSPSVRRTPLPLSQSDSNLAETSLRLCLFLLIHLIALLVGVCGKPKVDSDSVF